MNLLQSVGSMILKHLFGRIKLKRNHQSRVDRVPMQIGQRDWFFVDALYFVGDVLVLSGWSSSTPNFFVPESEQQFRIIQNQDRPDVREFLVSKGVSHTGSANIGFLAALASVENYQEIIVEVGEARVKYSLPEPSLLKDGIIAILRQAGLIPTEHFYLSPTQTDASARHPHASAIEDMFDHDFYLGGFRPEEQPSDPVSHYLSEGWIQGRQPTPWFSTTHYLANHPDVAAANLEPFYHYCVAGKQEGRTLPILGNGNAADESVYNAQAFAVEPGPYFEEFDPSIGVGRQKRAKVLAYYLPQFHPVDINDKQWGAGFTEWRQLPRAMPRFEGHIQPRIPRDLGCYSLAEGDVMRRQINMAKAAGLYGFCFYHYWFDGKRVLEKPMERFLADPTLEFPFCIMWANENWTRTWDGSEKEVILALEYREENEISLIDDFARHMKDPRYIRLNNRPILFIYRAGQIPQTKKTIARWRKLFRSRHDIAPLFFQAQAFGDDDPRLFGFDGAIEFPPHKVLNNAPDVKHMISMIDRQFEGTIVTYESIVKSAERGPAPAYPLIRTVFPSWDNDARRPGRSTIVANSTPKQFADWLGWAVFQAEMQPIFGESIVCVNAWNEWAEGAYLEPDVHFGAAYLNALARVVFNAEDVADHKKRRILLVGHDAMNFGAQILLANIARTFVRQFGCEVKFLLISESWKDGIEGDLITAYEAIGTVTCISPHAQELPNVLAKLKASGFSNAIINTTVAGGFVSALKMAKFHVVSLIHELPNLLHANDLGEQSKAIATMSDQVIFPASVVRKGFEKFAGRIQHRSEVLPQGLYKKNLLTQKKGDHGLRAELGLKLDTKIVLGVGYADLRKGIDRFVTTGLSLAATHENISFIWVGAASGESSKWFEPEIQNAGLADRVRVLGNRDDIARFYAAADAFYLSSREDPFPSVVLEALAIGLPVIGHSGCGGCDDLIEKHGILIPQSNPLAAAPAILKAISKSSARASKLRRDEVIHNYEFGTYAFKLLERATTNTSSISAIVPNYNYEKFVGDRLSSVFQQSYPLREVIVLDDASTDNSLAEIERTAQLSGRFIELHVNNRNQGSPFKQWRRGLELAKGEYVWIAEADDLADSTFVARLIDRMQQAGSVLGFTDSRQIDENGNVLGHSYRDYINEIEPQVFDQAFDMSGQEFLGRFLAVKNVILNVSSALVHRQTMLDAFDAVGDELWDYEVAGDWRIYLEILARKDAVVSWLPQPLNTHRRHGSGVTYASDVNKHLAEIKAMHQLAQKRLRLAPEKISQQARHINACRVHLTKEA